MYQKLNWTWRVKYAKVYKMRLTERTVRCHLNVFFIIQKVKSWVYPPKKERDGKKQHIILLQWTHTNMSNERAARTHTDTLTTVQIWLYVFLLREQWHGPFNCGFHKWSQSAIVFLCVCVCCPRLSITKRRGTWKTFIILPPSSGALVAFGWIEKAKEQKSFVWRKRNKLLFERESFRIWNKSVLVCVCSWNLIWIRHQSHGIRWNWTLTHWLVRVPETLMTFKLIIP